LTRDAVSPCLTILPFFVQPADVPITFPRLLSPRQVIDMEKKSEAYLLVAEMKKFRKEFEEVRALAAFWLLRLPLACDLSLRVSSLTA
jgi:hypothetical protein